ncbi:hypothetical protein LTS10_003628 [Elasticomyces elasticus]|nr:hypothetical protein LTS10_003628 [Elasticomyces elasticus]
MGKPTAKAPPPAEYRDDPDDAVSMHTTPDDYQYDDIPDPPSYSDSEAVATSSNGPSNVGQDAPPLDEYAVIPVGTSSSFRGQSRGKVVTGSETTIRMDERLEDPTELYNYITNALALLPPKIQVRMRGWHNETIERSNNKKGTSKETNTVIDFDMGFSLVRYLPSSSAEAGWQPYNVADNDRAYRGSWRKTRVQGQDIETASASLLGEDVTDAHPTSQALMRWVTDYCQSKAKLRIFRVTREVDGLDTTAITAAIDRLIRSTNYRGHISISFPIADKQVDVYSPHNINRWRISWIRFIFYFTFLWIFTWPILFFCTKRWDVYRVRWCWSWPAGEPGGTRWKVYARITEDDWIAKHQNLIKNLVLDRFQGDATDLPVEVEERSTRQPTQTGNAHVDAAASLFREGLSAWNSVSGGRNSGGWGGDS